jgi:hypothetical protein
MPRTKRPALLPPASLVSEDEALAVDVAADAIHGFEKALGGRRAFIEALAIDGSPAIRVLLSLLLDSHYDRYSLGQLAVHAKIGLTDLLRAYRNNRLARAQILAVDRIAARLPAVVEDVMRRAMPHEGQCSICRGTGKVLPEPTKRRPDPTPVKCGVCNGKGTRMILPDLERQKLALEIGELLRVPKNGPTVLQQFNFPGGGSGPVPGSSLVPGALEQMQQAVARVLYDPRRPIELPPIEAEAVPEGERSP